MQASEEHNEIRPSSIAGLYKTDLPSTEGQF